MKRESRRQKHGSSERWLVTYSDLITLLLIFFIIMYSLSRIDIKKFQNLAGSLSQAMGGGGLVFQELGPSIIPGISGTEAEKAEQIAMENMDKIEMEKLQQGLISFIQKAGLEAKVSVVNEERGIVLSFQESVLFEIGSAELTPRARELLSRIGPLLSVTPNYIRVEGHTCDIPIHNSLYSSNWELSGARALTTVQQLISGSHFPPQQLSAVAYGEYRPQVPNDSEANRQINRRVDIVILRSKFKSSEAGNVTRP